MQTPEIGTVKQVIDLVVVYGGTLVIFASLVAAGVYYLAAFIKKRVAEMNRISEDDVVKARAIVRQLDEKEIETSHAKAKAVQNYLDRHAADIFTQGVDRVTVWLNHNGTRSGSFHFLFYSLVAEIVDASSGAPSFGASRISPTKLPYYLFADYEREICEDGHVFRHARDLTGAPAALARDFGSKTIYGLPIRSDTSCKLDGIIFFTSCNDEMAMRPDLDHVAADVKSLLSPF